MTPLSLPARSLAATFTLTVGLVLGTAVPAGAQETPAATQPAAAETKPAAAEAKAADAKPKPPTLPDPLPEFLDTNTVRKPDGMIVRFYRVNAVDPKLVQQELDRWKSKKATIAPWGPSFVVAKGAQIQNVLRIEEHEDNWPVLERILAMVDAPQPQVYVEAKIVEISYDDDVRIGLGPSNVRVDRPVGDLFFKRIDFNFDNTLGNSDVSTVALGAADKFVKFDYLLQLGRSGAKAEVIAEPSVSAVQGETATIDVGEREPIVQQDLRGTNVTATTKFEPVGLYLEITPLLIGRDLVRARVNPRLSRVSDFRTVSTSADRDVINPVIATREAKTVVEVMDGDTVVISGLQQTSEVEQRRGIPILMDIPLIGGLFGSTGKRTVKTELVFFVTFSISYPGEGRVVVPPSERERTE